MALGGEWEGKITAKMRIIAFVEALGSVCLCADAGAALHRRPGRDDCSSRRILLVRSLYRSFDTDAGGGSGGVGGEGGGVGGEGGEVRDVHDVHNPALGAFRCRLMLLLLLLLLLVTLLQQLHVLQLLQRILLWLL